ncbi:unnamed protein product [Arctia plantaginis]|uniref:Uncharacterized protein n=1 Tax=Arctia plantaginis TaxID=874455 RepID=A0A8S0YM71_ARCPL|nr:unnamed protein product [Arctia plantaginis]
MYRLMCAFFIVLIKTSESNKRQKNPDVVNIPSKVDNIDHLAWPVPFGHVYKEGFGDIGGLKAPVDILDLNVRHPMTSEEARELLQTTDPHKIQFHTQYVEARGYTNPRDRAFKELGIKGPGPEINATQFKWFNLGDLEARNVARKPFVNPPRRTNGGRRPVGPPPMNSSNLIGSSFVPQREHRTGNVNLTQCDEFGSKAYFFPKDIVNLDWVPFYVWAFENQTARIHSFKYATKKLVRSVRELYRKFIKIDWEQPKLLYNGIGQFLLVAADKRGLFHALQIIDSPPAEVVGSIPYTRLRLKIEDPYLVVMYCTDYFAAIMALVGNEPQTDKEKEEEASTVGIKGKGFPVSRDLQEEKMNAMRELEMKQIPIKPVDTDVPKLKDLKP